MIWTSDDTDPIERLSIQGGISQLYPLSVISAHVSASPHQQTLRDTPLSTRFNVAAFGCLGYEYDLDFLTAEEKREISEQIAFYKRHRRTFQFGRFRRIPSGRAERVIWQVGEGDAAIVGNFQRGVRAAPERDILPIAGLHPDGVYAVEAKPQRIMLARLGALVNHVSPVKLDPTGLVMNVVSKHKSLPDGVESYRGTGSLLAAGIRLQLQFSGTGHTDALRMLGDFGSTLYTVVREENP
jgi:alpha-galactosidase